MNPIKKIASLIAGGKEESKPAAAVLNALAGKVVTFQGRFPGRQRWQHACVVELAKAQQGTVVDELDANTHYLVVADLTSAKGAQQKAAALNAKGAAIQIVDLDAFQKQISPSADQFASLVRGGRSNREAIKQVLGGRGYVVMNAAPAFEVTAEKFDGVSLELVRLHTVEFIQCSFVGAMLKGVHMGRANSCDFSRASGESAHFLSVHGCRFVDSNLPKAQFGGSFAGADFSGAKLESSRWLDLPSRLATSAGPATPATSSPTLFRKTAMQKAQFLSVTLHAPDFGNAHLGETQFSNCKLTAAVFKSADLRGAKFWECHLQDCDFTSADLRGAVLNGCDLSGCRFDGADLKDADLSGSKLDRADLSKARNYIPVSRSIGAVGPALTELNALCQQARSIRFTIALARPGEETRTLTFNSNGLRWGMATTISKMPLAYARPTGQQTASDALLKVALIIGQAQLRYETLEVKSAKSPKTGKELRALIMDALAEAMLQPVPSAEKLAELTAAHRQQAAIDQAPRLQAAKEAKAKRDEYKRKQEEQRQSQAAALAQSIEQQVGKISDLASFLRALELRIDKQKIDKATKMLKAERFKLFNDLTPDRLSGVIKSQSDPDLLYACQIHKDGKFCCCTQNLNVCGGLRGSLCKHLLVLIVGLVKAGQLDPALIDRWIGASHGVKPALDKEAMGEVFIKYKGAEAGEIDWRPTETLPEDFYAV
jgi:uncharacterized protein YjbI with pentapeptide repeats